jgi:uncharacterized protein (TIGR00369 family)
MTSAAEQLEAFLQRVPYVRFLGMRAELAGDELTAILPYKQSLVGNVYLPAIHGGVLGAFMELTAQTQLAIAQQTTLKVPKAIDVTIEYLRSGRPVTTYARAEVRKVGKRVANVHVEAWQEERGAPVAALGGHFMMTPDD